MSVRIAVPAVLAAAVVLMLRPEPGAVRAQSAPTAAPRMFSPWYAESLRDILRLEESDVASLERQLAANADDFPARLKLMAYHQRGDRQDRPEDRGKRVQHALWLIEHHPESELLHSPVSRFAPSELPETDYRRAIALWNAATQARPSDAAVQWNAASFFEGLNPDLHLRYMEATAAADPNHPFAVRPLAHLYALSILEGGPLAARSRAALEASKNVWVLGNAAYVLQSQYNRLLQMGTPNPLAAELAERYFQRAQALDPNLDRKAILPQLDLQEIARAEQTRAQAQQDWQARAEEAVAKIRHLSAEAFPELPPAIAGVLRARNCTVPQPSTEGAARNVIRGEFFAKGETGWAVFCSVNNSTALLAFRNDRDTNPQTVTTSEDRGYLQGLENDKIGYSREITAVNRDFIMSHYRAYGGPEPPPIDHQGIDDAFLEKASVTWYHHEGQWLRLQGAD
ncbi:MAG: hypothetical protein LC114_25025 [Bryobacterales bacterium]|jgi:hypothetical protein|nr:hypothetical protein [Bryobacterales bacterium]